MCMFALMQCVLCVTIWVLDFDFGLWRHGLSTRESFTFPPFFLHPRSLSSSEKVGISAVTFGRDFNFGLWVRTLKALPFDRPEKDSCFNLHPRLLSSLGKVSFAAVPFGRDLNFGLWLRTLKALAFERPQKASRFSLHPRSLSSLGKVGFAAVRSERHDLDFGIRLRTLNALAFDQKKLPVSNTFRAHAVMSYTEKVGFPAVLFWCGRSLSWRQRKLRFNSRCV